MNNINFPCKKFGNTNGIRNIQSPYLYAQEQFECYPHHFSADVEDQGFPPTKRSISVPNAAIWTPNTGNYLDTNHLNYYRQTCTDKLLLDDQRNTWMGNNNPDQFTQNWCHSNAFSEPVVTSMQRGNYPDGGYIQNKCMTRNHIPCRRMRNEVRDYIPCKFDQHFGNKYLRHQPINFNNLECVADCNDNFIHPKALYKDSYCYTKKFHRSVGKSCCCRSNSCSDNVAPYNVYPAPIFADHSQWGKNCRSTPFSAKELHNNAYSFYNKNSDDDIEFPENNCASSFPGDCTEWRTHLSTDNSPHSRITAQPFEEYYNSHYLQNYIPESKLITRCNRSQEKIHNRSYKEVPFPLVKYETDDLTFDPTACKRQNACSQYLTESHIQKVVKSKQSNACNEIISKESKFNSNISFNVKPEKNFRDCDFYLENDATSSPPTNNYNNVQSQTNAKCFAASIIYSDKGNNFSPCGNMLNKHLNTSEQNAKEWKLYDAMQSRKDFNKTMSEEPKSSKVSSSKEKSTIKCTNPKNRECYSISNRNTISEGDDIYLKKKTEIDSRRTMETSRKVIEDCYEETLKDLISISSPSNVQNKNFKSPILDENVYRKSKSDNLLDSIDDAKELDNGRVEDKMFSNLNRQEPPKRLPHLPLLSSINQKQVFADVKDSSELEVRKTDFTNSVRNNNEIYDYLKHDSSSMYNLDESKNKRFLNLISNCKNNEKTQETSIGPKVYHCDTPNGRILKENKSYKNCLVENFKEAKESEKLISTPLSSTKKLEYSPILNKGTKQKVVQFDESQASNDSIYMSTAKTYLPKCSMITDDIYRKTNNVLKELKEVLMAKGKWYGK